MSSIIVQSICKDCGGDGLRSGGIPPSSTDECGDCNGTGYIEVGRVVLPTNIFHSHEVLECIDVTEYAELTDAQQDGVKLLLSCGYVDLNDEKSGKVRLWSWFGAESNTVANLTELVGG